MPNGKLKVQPSRSDRHLGFCLREHPGYEVVSGSQVVLKGQVMSDCGQMQRNQRHTASKSPKSLRRKCARLLRYEKRNRRNERWHKSNYESNLLTFGLKPDLKTGDFENLRPYRERTFWRERQRATRVWYITPLWRR